MAPRTLPRMAWMAGAGSEQHGCGDHQSDRERQDANIQLECGPGRNLITCGRQQDAERPAPEQEPGDTADCRQCEVLEQKLSRQPGRAGPDREPDAHLPPPSQRACEHHARDIGTCDHEQQRDRRRAAFVRLSGSRERTLRGANGQRATPSAPCRASARSARVTGGDLSQQSSMVTPGFIRPIPAYE